MIILGIILAFSLLAIASNWWRSQLEVDFSLMPNCLMTRSPIVFVSGLRSPFYFQNYWNRIPLYLREHGYEVLEQELAWRDAEQRRADLTLFLNVAKDENLTFHFIFDGTCASDVEWLQRQNHLAVKTLTVATVTSMGLKPRPLVTLNPLYELAAFCHKLYLPQDPGFSPVVTGLGSKSPELSVEKEFLRLAISLAEKEIKLTDTDREHSRGNVTDELHQ